jgi:predicted hydrocarbon binding protein
MSFSPARGLMYKSVLALFVCFFPSAALAQQAKSAPPCKWYFEALNYDQAGAYRLGLSESQIKWWQKNHEKKFPSLCYSEDIGKVHYILMWTTMASRQSYSQTVERSVQVQSASTGTETGTFDVYGDLSAHGSYNGQSDVSTTSTITYPETVSVAFSVDHCFTDVIRTFGPTVRDDIENKRPVPPSVFGFEAHRGRSTSDPTASGQVGFAIGRALVKEPTVHALESALEYITSDFEQNADIVHERMATVNALVAKVHELSVASQLPESDEPACAQKISQQIGANSEMLAHLEQRDFSDVETLFGQLCESSNNQR